ncbi:hydrolase [Leptospira biflexa]|uniref:YheT family hydrolase n=1 Tax=Leptospira biflexa TaxID=172 RepID=UPI001091579A|nr:alpha/beta fold hydrolase [Leptospira biflexa]TGM42400.1 hydrolase [Leptospira biflexa]TGM44286.1 hydrolase [Leptospira biflexa]
MSLETVLYTIFAIILFGFIFYYFVDVIEFPKLRFHDSELSSKIISQTPSLTKRYVPTFWCFNQHLMLLLLIFRESKSKLFLYDKIEHLEMRDGGTTGLAWSGLHAVNQKDATPIVVVFHTISGDEQDIKSTVSHLRKTLNWIVVVCIRRGHGNLPLTKPIINTMGSTSDLKEQLNHIRRLFPNKPLFGVGISAGSGLLARYLGESGTKSMFSAAVAVSPAYDIEKAFHRVHPVYSKIMGQRMINYFLKRHYESFAKVKGTDELLKVKSLGEFQDKLHSISGFKNKESYYQKSNPILVTNQIKTPLLVLNAADDPICVNLNVLENLHWLESLKNTIHVHTKRGSHIAFFEGIFAKSWSNRLIAEYFFSVWELITKNQLALKKNKIIPK